MGNMRYIFLVGIGNLRRWRNAPRICVLLLMLLVITLVFTFPFLENARMQNQPLSIFEPMIALLNHRFSMLICSTIILLIFCDVPNMDTALANTLLRGSRITWILGQLFYVLIASFMIASTIVLMTMILSIPNSFIGNEWSKPVLSMALAGKIALPPQQLLLTIGDRMVKLYSPYHVALYSFLLFYLLTCFYGLFVLLLNMKTYNASMPVLLVGNLVSWVCTSFFPDEGWFKVFAWFSPHYHAFFDIHLAYLVPNSKLPSPIQSLLLLLALSVVMVTLACMFIVKYDFIKKNDV